MQRLLPTGRTPDIDLALAGGGRWSIGAYPPNFMVMLDIYRGYHCPRCRRHLEALNAASREFRELSLDVVAISMDGRERADKTRAEWDVADVPIGYGLNRSTAEALGLFLSRRNRDGEPEVFAEPGIFFIRSDLTLYGAIINSFPFARPTISDLVEVARVVRDRNYPARGDVATAA